jgi:DNA-binding XRE family transcriptional regulator
VRAEQDRFGRELRRLRERAGLTQVQLATRLGYDHTYLSKLESGARLPQIAFAGQADDLLNADGALLALATNARARRHSQGDLAAGAAVMPLPYPPSSASPVKLPPVRRIHLPAYGVTCPLHGTVGCTLSAPPTSLTDLLDDHARTAGAETVHGFAALLTIYIEADLQALTGDLAVPVEQTLRALLDLVPKARGPVSVGLLHLASQYADLAGGLRVKRGQHGIGMAWLQRSLEWALASHNLPTACEALGRMSALARLEGDAATALEYGRAAAAVDPDRRWTLVQSKLNQARGLAVLGDWREFERHSREAQRAAERLDDRDRFEAPWLFGAEGEALIASHLAGGLRDLADTTGDRSTAGRAVGFAQTSLANVPARMHASRLLLTLRLADSQACSGDLEAAIAVARPVIQAAESARITLVSQELDRLRTRLGDRSSELLDDC